MFKSRRMNMIVEKFFSEKMTFLPTPSKCDFIYGRMISTRMASSKLIRWMVSADSTLTNQINSTKS